MASQLVVDLGADRQIRVSTVLDGEESSTPGAPETLLWPLNGSALEDLRWYLEDYLSAPYAVYEDRGARIEADLMEWGREIFKAVFGSGSARDAYLQMRTRDDLELVFRSDAPSLLGLPWELMVDPSRDAPLALGIAGVSRSLSAPPDRAEATPVPGGRLRVLMVISRPAGTGDVGYQMIARPLLDRLEAVRGKVDLVVLRPPTLDALRTELQRAADSRAPYQAVHFDGHGAFLGLRTSDVGEGVLFFEHPDGGEQLVSAQSFGRVLVDAGVPVVVLNACQSGAVGKELEATVATRLLRDGVASVVAMAYSVYATAAAEFMAAFYERLFAGGTVASAVTAGRQQLHRVPARPSPRGALPLADWVVPVHYFRRDVSFPQAVVERPDALSPLEVELAERTDEAGRAAKGDLYAVDGIFVGRDALFYRMEEAARLQKVVVLTGPAGTGKTELAKAFGRWWRDTGGVDNPGWVFWHSFEPGLASTGLESVISALGSELYGPRFALLEPEQRRSVIRKTLIEQRMLLIWDNFESVRSMPEPGRATPPLDDESCADIREFLADLAAHGKTSVLITSRTTEDWLTVPLIVKIGGLDRSEAVRYADALLARYTAAHEWRAGRGFSDLMAWLAGHPLSMRLILPRLAHATPEALLASLQGTEPPADENDGGHRQTDSLAASVAYSYAHLQEQARRMLPYVSLFHGVADVEVLTTFSMAAGLPARAADAARAEWKEILDNAVRVGLLTDLGRGMYRLHPALPGHLAGIWRRENPESYSEARAAADRAFLMANAVLGDRLKKQIESGEARIAYEIISLEQHTLGSLLKIAIDQQLWTEALHIAQPLGLYWVARGLDTELDAWVDQVCAATGDLDGSPPEMDTAAGDLWIFFITSQASRDVARGLYDRAERRFRQIIEAYRESDSTSSNMRSLGIAYHNLGLVFRERGQLTEAEQWHRKSMAIGEKIQNRQLMASSYHEMAILAWRKEYLAESEKWCVKALGVWRDSGDEAGVARSYHLLGMIARNQYHLDLAREYLRKALALREELKLPSEIAATYHELGVVAHMKRSLAEAEDWLGKGLSIGEAIGNRGEMANTYHELGMIAQDRGRLAEAGEWYSKALAISDEFDDRAGMIMTRNQLGILARIQGRLDEAEAWHQRALNMAYEAGDSLWNARACDGLGLVAKQRGQLPDALFWTISAVEILSHIPYQKAGEASLHLVQLASIVGMAALRDAWKRVTGYEMPDVAQQYVEDQLQQEERE